MRRSKKKLVDLVTVHSRPQSSSLLRMTDSEKSGQESESLGSRMGDGAFGRVARALFLDDAPRDFGPEVAFNLRITSLLDTWPPEQALRERNVGP